MARWQAARLHHGRSWPPRKSPQPRVTGRNRFLQISSLALINSQLVCTLRSLGTVASSGGWVRASGLLLFRETLLPSELHRNAAEHEGMGIPRAAFWKEVLFATSFQSFCRPQEAVIGSRMAHLF